MPTPPIRRATKQDTKDAKARMKIQRQKNISNANEAIFKRKLSKIRQITDVAWEEAITEDQAESIEE